MFPVLSSNGTRPVRKPESTGDDGTHLLVADALLLGVEKGLAYSGEKVGRSACASGRRRWPIRVV
jgi:hypothetical protein